MLDRQKFTTYLSIFPGEIFGWTYWLAIVEALTGTVPVENFHFIFYTVFIPPIIAPFIFNHIQRSVVGTVLLMCAIISCGFALTVYFLMVNSAILISTRFRHLVPARLTSIDFAISIGSCIFFAILVVLLILPSKYLSDFYHPVKLNGGKDTKCAK